MIAVKPQIAPEVLPALEPLVGTATLALSIMAGRTLGFLQGRCRRARAIVRAMPNTPAAIGRGITVAVANAQCRRGAAQAGARDLLAAIGAVEWVERRGADGRRHRGLRLRAGLCVPAGRGAGARPASPPACRPLAARLARATVAGSGELLHRSTLDAATLRQNVTSPGGTTAAALDVLMGPRGFQNC